MPYVKPHVRPKNKEKAQGKCTKIQKTEDSDLRNSNENKDFTMEMLTQNIRQLKNKSSVEFAVGIVEFPSNAEAKKGFLKKQ